MSSTTTKFMKIRPSYHLSPITTSTSTRATRTRIARSYATLHRSTATTTTTTTSTVHQQKIQQKDEEEEEGNNDLEDETRNIPIPTDKRYRERYRRLPGVRNSGISLENVKLPDGIGIGNERSSWDKRRDIDGDNGSGDYLKKGKERVGSGDGNSGGGLVEGLELSVGKEMELEFKRGSNENSIEVEGDPREVAQLQEKSEGPSRLNPSTSAPPDTTPSSTTAREQVRKRRKEMERLWDPSSSSSPNNNNSNNVNVNNSSDIPTTKQTPSSNKEPTPAPSPTSPFATHHLYPSKPNPSKAPKRTALLFPGSGSQYISMGSSLLSSSSSNSSSSFRRTWEEAEEVLEGFEKWRVGQGLGEGGGGSHQSGGVGGEREKEGWMMRLTRDLGVNGNGNGSGGGESAEQGPGQGQGEGRVRLGDWARKDGERYARGGGGELRRVVMEGDQDLLTRSSNAQPSILITSIAFLRVLENEFGVKGLSGLDPKPSNINDKGSNGGTMADFFLGHSSGEFSAAVASGAIGFADGVRLTRLHGLLTHQTLLDFNLKPYTDSTAPDEKRAQMSALVLVPGGGVDETDIFKEIDKVRREKGLLVEVASFNSSFQLVLSGSRAGILSVCHELETKGMAARAADLPVAAPFHCSFMKPAAEEMKRALEVVGVKKPFRPLVSGVNAQPVISSTSLINHLVSQIYSPVHWSASLSFLLTGIPHHVPSLSPNKPLPTQSSFSSSSSFSASSSSSSSWPKEKNNYEPIRRLIFLGPGKALANLARKEILHGKLKGLVKLAKPGSDSGDENEVEILSVATEDDLRNVGEILAREREGL